VSVSSEPRRKAVSMKELLIRLVVGLAVIVVVVITVTWVAGDDLTKPSNRDIQIGRPPPGLEASNITFASRSGGLIHGWLSSGKPGQGAVILLHGLRGDRRDMVSRAEFLHARGYSVLLFDFQGHGESRGSRITFGDLESGDVTAAIQYLHHKLPNEQVGVIGASLGAAAFVLAEQRPAVAAVVLEQMYPTIQQAVAGRARQYLGPLAPVFAPLLMAQAQARIEIPATRQRPVDRMAQVGAPVLIVNGTQDNYTSIEDARALFAAASDPKELWAVEGAGHVNLYTFAKTQYEQRIGDFLGRHLH
jgi:uncharacterized protein